MRKMYRKMYFVCIIALLSAMIMIPASAKTWYVNDDGGYDFTNIQDALNAASDGDTVFVYNGSYGGGIVINKPNITLKGEGADVVTYDGQGIEPGGWVAIGTGANAYGTVVERLTIKNAPLKIPPGYNVANVIIRDIVFDSPPSVITISGSNSTFMNNLVVNATPTSRTLYIPRNGTTIVNNTFLNGSGEAIRLGYAYYGPNSIIAKNNFIRNKAGIGLYTAGNDNKIYLNNFIDNINNTIYSGTPPATIFWNSTEPIEYTYGGTPYANYLGNYWKPQYTGTDADGDGIGDAPYGIPGSATDKDFRPLVSKFENYPAPAGPEPPHLATYTISNRTITPPQTTEIDVEFSEYVKAWISIEDSSRKLVKELYYSANVKNPAPKIWNGTYANGTQVPDGSYYVNVTGTNTTTGLSVVNNTEVITVTTTTEQPDLIVSEVDAYHYEGAKTGFAWFNLSNYVDVTVKNNGTADAGAFNISLYADGEFIGEQRIANLSAGSNETLVFEWKPIGLDEQDGGSPHTYSMLAKADPYNAVSESDEFNNNMTVSETVKYNGYMADEPLNTFSHGTLRGGLLFTTGDANYIGATYPGLIGSVHYNVDIPQTSSVMLARLNIYYTWAKYWSPYPVLRVEITNQTGTYNVSLKAAYHDRAGSFSGWNLPWGNYVYDLSDYIKQNGSYTVTIYNNGTGYQSLAIASPGLIVLYSDESMPLIEYWLAEGADVLMGGRRSDSGSYLTLEECINNATFEGSIELSRVKNAALGIVSPWGSWGWFPGSGNVLYFNDVEIGRSPNVYLNGWNAIGDISLGGIRMTGTGAGQVGVNLSNVTDYLNTNINTAGQGDDGDNMMPVNAFLLVEVAEVPDFSISVSPGSASVTKGGSTSATVTLTSILGYDKNVTLGASGMPLNTTISFTPEKGKPTPTFTSAMLVKTDNTTPVGSHPITIKGTGEDAKVHSTTFTLSVTTTKGGANASVSLTTNIIPAIAIEVTPSSINFGELSPGETSSGNNLTVKNKGGYSINVSAEVTDSAENLFVNGALLNDKLWSLYSAVIPKSGDDKPVAKLYVPDDYAGVGAMEGTMMFWAKKA